MPAYIRVLMVDENDNPVASGKSYQAYTALLSQAGTGAPSPTVLENDFNAPIVWARTGVGVYTGTLASAFISGKTFFDITPADAMLATCTRNSTDVFTLNTFTMAGDAADVFTNMSVEVRVYS